MSITVGDILKLASFSDAKIIAGEDGLDRLIENVSVIEVPQSKEWFEENELYITAFYSIKDNIKLQLKTLKKIKDCNAAGICYIDLYVFDLESEIIKYADKNKIPIIRIPNEVPYSSMISSIMRKIVRKKNEEIYYSHKLKKGLINLFNEDDSEKIVNILDDISGCPIIYKSKYNKLNISKKGKKIPENILKKIIDGKNELKSEHFPEEINYDVYNIEREDPREKLIIIYFNKESISSLRSKDFIMEIAQIRFTLKKHKEYLFKTKRKQLKNEVFSLLLEDNINFKLLANKASELNWKLEKRFAVLNLAFSESNKNNLYRYINKLKSVFGERILIIERRDNLIGIISFNKIEESNIYNKLNKTNKEIEFFSFINLINNNKKETKEEPIYIGVGSSCENISHIKRSYQEAKKIIDFLKKVNQPFNVCFWNDLFVYLNILENTNIDSIRTYIENVLGHLLNEEHAEIFNTLFYYLNLCKDRYKTAEKLNIHYNTVKYRIDKAQKIVDFDLNNNKEKILFALNLYAILLSTSKY